MGLRGHRRPWIPAFAGMTMVLLISACERKPAPPAPPQAGAETRIACQPAGAERFEPVCLVERALGPDGLTLVIHHPDGSFRRLLVVRDGRGVVAADGADPAVVRIADTIGEGGEIEVTLAGNRYLLPATIKQPT